MNTKIDLKSALCGLVIGVLAMLAIGATESSSNPIGRYQCSAAIDLMLIVDTATGQAWATRPAGLSITGSAGGVGGFFEKKTDK